MGYNRAIFIRLERKQIDERLIADHDAGGMHGSVAGEVFEDESDVDYLARDLFGLIGLLEFRGLLEGFGQIHFQLVRNHFGKAVTVAIAQTHDARDIADDGLGAHGAEGDDLRDRVASVFLADIFDDLRASIIGKVDVDIGRVDAFGIEEALEEQIVADGIDVGDFEQIGDNGPCGGAPRHAIDAMFAAIAHKIADDQEVADETGFLDDRQLCV